MKTFKYGLALLILALVAIAIPILAGDFLYPAVAVANGGTYGTATIGRKTGQFTLTYLMVVPDTFTTGTLKLQILTDESAVFYESGSITSGTAVELVTNTDSKPAKPIKSNWTIKMIHSAATSKTTSHKLYYLLE